MCTSEDHPGYFLILLTGAVLRTGWSIFTGLSLMTRNPTLCTMCEVSVLESTGMWLGSDNLLVPCLVYYRSAWESRKEREESHHKLQVWTKTERLETTQQLRELKCFSAEIVRKDASFYLPFYFFLVVSPYCSTLKLTDCFKCQCLIVIYFMWRRISSYSPSIQCCVCCTLFSRGCMEEFSWEVFFKETFEILFSVLELGLSSHGWEKLTTPENSITYHNALCLSSQNFA